MRAAAGPPGGPRRTGTGGGGCPAPAPSSAVAASAAAEAAAGTVDQLTRRYREAGSAEAAAAAHLAAAFAEQAAADSLSVAEQARAERARAEQTAQVRAIYVDGGQLGLLMTVLSAGSPDDALWRLSTASRVENGMLVSAGLRTADAVGRAGASAASAASAAAATARLAAALRDVQEHTAEADALLVRAQLELARLRQVAGKLAAAEAAARRLAAARAAVEAARLSTGTDVTALPIPPAYVTAYRQAATTCPGMDWTLLAGVGQVESGHGRNNGPSSAGAIGPMQFMPATFAAYAVDGNGDGVRDPWNYRDAIFTAARYLCASGADGTAAGVHTALLAYNHAEWYVDLVLGAQRAVAAAYPAGR